jgi:hypothetical protein
MVTKKWVLVKRNKQVNALSPCLSNLPPPIKTKWTVGMKDRELKGVIEMAMLLEVLGLPP